jgi:glycosyltransferase involved in cell wall biosynthesis
MKVKWTINGRFLTHKVTGVQRYGREIVSALDALIDEDDARTRELSFEILAPKSAKLDLALKHIPIRLAGWRSGQVWEQTYLGPSSSRRLLSLCNTGPLFHAGQIVCFHDVNTIAFPKSYSLQFRMAYRVLTPLLGKTARRVATVSEYSATQLIEHGIARREKIFVAYNGSEHAQRWAANAAAAGALSEKRDRILLLGSLAPHKNIGLILGLADRLKAEGLRVCVVGGANAQIFNAMAGGLEHDNIEWLGPVNDDRLAELFGSALCLAFPSLAEGFGIPPLEAMTLGCPVVSSDATALPEVCGDAALYASPFDADAWMDAFKRLRDEPALRTDMIARGHARARQFSWRKSASRYLDAMLELA